MGGSLKLSWILVLVLMLSPMLNEMEMVEAAEVSKLYETNRKLKEFLTACDDNECQTECDNDGYGRGHCWSGDCVCFQTKKMEAEEAEKRQALDKDRQDVQQQQHAEKMDVEVSGQLH